MVIGVQHGIILDGTVFADNDVSVVGTYNRSGPDAGAFPDDHVADDIGSFTDESGRMDARAFTV
tara:strand:+ start:294 stop:485 length:192 start_codon:yes stop_codon:yes gene_type:complete